MRRRTLLNKAGILKLGWREGPVCQELNCMDPATTEVIVIVRDMDVQMFFCDKHSQKIERVLE